MGDRNGESKKTNWTPREPPIRWIPPSKKYESEEESQETQKRLMMEELHEREKQLGIYAENNIFGNEKAITTPVGDGNNPRIEIQHCSTSKPLIWKPNHPDPDPQVCRASVNLEKRWITKIQIDGSGGTGECKIENADMCSIAKYYCGKTKVHPTWPVSFSTLECLLHLVGIHLDAHESFWEVHLMCALWIVRFADKEGSIESAPSNDAYTRLKGEIQSLEHQITSKLGTIDSSRALTKTK